MGKGRVSFAALPCALEDVECGDSAAKLGSLRFQCTELVRNFSNLSTTVVAGLSWSACSIGMTLLNKHAVAKSDASLAVVVVQMLVTVGCAIATCNLQFGEGTKLWAMSVPPLFAAMMATSILSRFAT